jgi:hypothetical protein
MYQTDVLRRGNEVSSVFQKVYLIWCTEVPVKAASPTQDDVISTSPSSNVRNDLGSTADTNGTITTENVNAPP